VVRRAEDVARQVDGEAIMQWVAERVAPHKRIRVVEFAEEIPKSPAGKILRRLLIAGGAGG
jgi:acyl-coenzyme A synthetase/AMP-(fatty) acid ligase